MILCNYIAPTFRETPCGGVDWAVNAFYGFDSRSSFFGFYMYIHLFFF